VNEELLRLSEREAERGAKLILWSEGNAVVLAGPSAERMLRNELILVGPDGRVAWRYVKPRRI
jgi:apolipoprotein N-acyltransferase